MFIMHLVVKIVVYYHALLILSVTKRVKDGIYSLILSVIWRERVNQSF